MNQSWEGGRFSRASLQSEPSCYRAYRKEGGAESGAARRREARAGAWGRGIGTEVEPSPGRRRERGMEVGRGAPVGRRGCETPRNTARLDAATGKRGHPRRRTHPTPPAAARRRNHPPLGASSPNIPETAGSGLAKQLLGKNKLSWLFF